MAVIYPYEARVADLGAIFAQAPPTSLKLFSNDVTPDLDSVIDDFVEADYSGYVSMDPVWGATTINGDDNAQTIALVCIYSHNGGPVANDVHGWYMIDGGRGTLKYAERFVGGSRAMGSLGDVIEITPACMQGGCP